MKVNQRKAGVLLSYVSQGIHILTNLVYTPIMLRLLGKSEYGLYQLVYSVVSYLSILSFGFSSAYLRFYSRYKAKDDDDEIEKLNGMFLTIFMVISLICICCGGIMIANIQKIFASGLTAEEYPKAKILMVILVFNLAITFPGSIFDSFTTSKERFFFQKMLVVLQGVFNPILTLPLLLLGYGSVAMVLVTTFLTIVKLCLNIWYCKTKCNIRFCFKGFRLSLLKEMWVFTFFIFINLIVDQINWSVDKFLLGRLTGTAAVAIYGVGAQINSMYMQFSTAVSSVFVPKINRIIAEGGDNRTLTQVFTKVGRIQFLILSLMVSGFVFFGRSFLRFWAGDGYDYSYGIALLLIIPACIPWIQNLGIEIQRAKNMHQARSVVYLLIAISNIFVSIPCIKAWGAQGAAIGTALTMLLGNGIFMNVYYHKKIGIDIVYFWREVGKFIPGLIAPYSMGILINKFINLSNIVNFLLCGVAYIVVFGISMWFFGINDEERRMISKPLGNIVRT